MITAITAAPPAAADPGTGFTPDRNAAATRVVGLSDGTRVALTKAAGGTAVQPLSRDTAGLLLSSGPAGTTLQPASGGSIPTVLAGTGQRIRAQRDADQQLVTLRLDALGRDGRAASAFVLIFDVEDGSVQVGRHLVEGASDECSTDAWAESSCVQVPPGTYSAMAYVQTNQPGRPSTADDRTAQSVSLVGDPQTMITGDRTLTFDARRAVPMSVQTPGHPTKINPGGAIQLSYTRTAADGTRISQEFRPAALIEQTFYQQPTRPVTLGGFDTLARLRLEAPDITLRTAGDRPVPLHPEYYEPVWFSDVSSDYPVLDGTAVLRVVDVGHATGADLAGSRLRGAVAVAERSDAVSVAEQSNAAAAAGAAMIVIYNDGPGDNDDPGGMGTKITIPTLRLSREEGLALRALSGRGTVTATGQPASPYVYDLVIKEHGRIPGELSYRYRTDQLASQVRQFHGQPTVGSSYSEAAYPYQPGDEFSISTMFPLRGGPQSRVEYRIPDPDTRWTFGTVTPESPYNALFDEDPVLPMVLSDPQRTAYEQGDRVIKPVATAPVTAGLQAPVQRSGDLMRIAISGFIDSDGNRGPAYSDDSGMATMLTITADGELVGQTEHAPTGIAQLPAGRSRTVIDFTTDNPQPWAELSTHTDTRWAFDSSTTAQDEVITEPLIIADYDVPVDLRNRLHGRRFQLHLDHQDGSGGSRIATVRLDASYDDGASWQPAEIERGNDGYRVTLPQRRGRVSLRLHAADATGSVLDQTIIRAFAVR